MRLFRLPFLVLLALATLLAGCAENPQSPAPKGVIIPTTTKVGDAATRAALAEYDPDTGVMRFSTRTATLAQLKADDVLVAEPSDAAPHGYLRQVKAIRTDGDAVILETTQANLTDAIHQGELEFTREMEPADLLEPELLVDGLSIASVLEPQAGFNFIARFDQTVLDINQDGVTSKVRINGSVAFNVGFNFGLSIGAKIFPPDVYLERFEASANVSQRAELRISGDARATFEKDVQVASIPFATFCVPVGPVPVCFSPTMYMFVGASGEVNLKFDYQVVQTFSAGIGTRYKRGPGWENIGYGPNFDTSIGSNPSISAKMKASGYARAEIGLMLYGLAGPTFGAKLGVELDAAIPRDPFWTMSAFLEAYYGLVVSVPILGRLADHRATIFKVSKEVGRSANAPPIIEVVQPNVRVDHGRPVEFHFFLLNGRCQGIFCISDPEDGVPSYTLTSNVDGRLPNDTHVFATPGLRTITIRATDRKGASTTATFRVDVINTPPTVYGSADGASVAATVPFFINAAASDPNSKLDCSALSWSVTAPDVVTSQVYGAACYGRVVFNAQGNRTVTLTATDPEGAVSKPRTFGVYVTDPPPTPAPYNTKPLTVHSCGELADPGKCPALEGGSLVKYTGSGTTLHFWVEAESVYPLTFRFTAQCNNCQNSSLNVEREIGTNSTGILAYRVPEGPEWMFRASVNDGHKTTGLGSVMLRFAHAGPK